MEIQHGDVEAIIVSQLQVPLSPHPVAVEKEDALAMGVGTLS